MKILKFYFVILLLFLLQSCSSDKLHPISNETQKLLMGSDQLISENLDLIKNKRLGIISNKASVLSNGVSLIDTLVKIEGVKIQALFSPEHGFSINNEAGQEVSDSAKDGIPIYSLYGKTWKPTTEMLKNIDMLIFDLQDIGTRFYTYISTLYYVMQSAGESHIPLIVTDRPNPIGGLMVDGPVLKENQKSFIGIAQIPVVHGMTMGEIAELFYGEHWIGKENLTLKIIKLKNWERSDYFEDSNLKWISPSPNIPDASTTLVYPATGFLEGTNISAGRGTEMPFKQFGAPFINSRDLIYLLDSLGHKGLSISSVTFTPVIIQGKADNPLYANEKCNGVLLNVTERKDFQAVEFGIKLLFSLLKLYPEKFKFDNAYFDKLTGDVEIRDMLMIGIEASEIESYWQPELKKFKQTRNKYLLY